jgi:hypothetical protein
VFGIIFSVSSRRRFFRNFDDEKPNTHRADERSEPQKKNIGFSVYVPVSHLYEEIKMCSPNLRFSNFCCVHSERKFVSLFISRPFYDLFNLYFPIPTSAARTEFGVSRHKSVTKELLWSTRVLCVLFFILCDVVGNIIINQDYHFSRHT